MGINHEVPPAYENLDGMERSDVQFWRERDIEENWDSKPPEGEAIGRPVVKVAECFVGGDVQALVDGCRALGIAPADNFIRTGDVYTWVEQVRRTSRTGSWVDVGAGHTRAQERAWADDVEMDLPEDFERVVLKAFSPRPSVVFLVATFVLTPEAAAGVDDELRTNRFLRLDKRGRFTIFASAAHRKGDAVRAERARVIEAASAWVAQTFAGTLSRDFTGTTLPSIEFLTTQINEPFTDPQPSGRAGRSDYTTLLSIDSA